MMQVTQESRENWLIVTVRGRVDSVTADELEDKLRGAVEQDDKVALDLHAVDYVSSAGLRAVLQAARAAEAKSRQFVVCALSAPVKKVFDMSGMHHILKIQGELPC